MAGTPASKTQRLLVTSYTGPGRRDSMKNNSEETEATFPGLHMKANNHSANNGNQYHETAQPWQQPSKIYENSNNGNVVFDKVVKGSHIMGEVLSDSTGSETTASVIASPLIY